jgi:phage shock protein A
MALISRLSRLIKADAHAVLDHIEDPEAVLRQAVRDMRAEVAQGEQRILMGQQTLAQREQHAVRAEQQIKQCNEQLDDCFDAGREDLARGVLRKRLQHQSTLENLNGLVDQQRETLDSDRSTLAMQRGVLESAEQKLAVLGRAGKVSRPASTDPQATPTVSDEQVELELMREKKARNQDQGVKQ